jgi:hypothetical protein
VLDGADDHGRLARLDVRADADGDVGEAAEERVTVDLHPPILPDA